MKGQFIEELKYLQITYLIQKILIEFMSKNQIIKLENDKREAYLPKEDTQMAKYMKSYSPSLGAREIQIKTIMTYHHSG